MGIRISIFLIVTICLISCRRNSITFEQSKEYAIAVDFEDPTEFGCVIDSIRTVKLESSKDNLISYCNRLIVHEDTIVVFDLSQQIVFIFNTKGEFLRKINKQGKGPEEYIRVEDVHINKSGDLVLFDAPRRELLYFNLDGQFLRKEKISSIQSCFNIREYNDGYLYFTGKKNNIDPEITNHYITIEDDKGRVKNFFDVSGVAEIKTLSPDNYLFVNSDHDIFFQEPYGKTIYKIGNNKIKGLFNIDLGKYSIPRQAFTCFDPNKFRQEYFFNNNYMLMIGSTQSTIDHFIVPLFRASKLYGCIFISKDSKRSFFVKNEGDLLLPRSTKGNTFIGIRDAFNSSTTDSESRDLKEFENPSVVFCFIKKF